MVLNKTAQNSLYSEVYFTTHFPILEAIEKIAKISMWQLIVPALFYLKSSFASSTYKANQC